MQKCIGKHERESLVESRLGSEVQKCIGKHERESICEPRARPDPHVLSMSWRAGMSVPPFRAFPPFLGPPLFISVLGDKQMRREIMSLENCQKFGSANVPVKFPANYGNILRKFRILV